MESNKRKRISTKIGDIFSAEVSSKKKKYFQLIAFDSTQLNSDVIRAFKKEYPIDYEPDFSEIVKGKVEFYAHCVTKFGIKLNLWKKVGNISDLGNIKEILFRGSRDSGTKVGEKIVEVSENWYVWRINDEKFTYVGKLNGKFKKADLGVVVNPYDVIERLQKGKYSFKYPGF